MLATHQSTSFIRAKVRSKLFSTSRTRRAVRERRRRISASSSSEKDDDSSPLSNALSRRELALIAASTVFSYYPDSSTIKLAHARNSSLPTVLVIGSTGQTGKLVVSSLSRTNNANVVAGCRSLEKAKKLQLDQNGVELLGGGKCTRSRSTKMF